MKIADAGGARDSLVVVCLAIVAFREKISKVRATIKSGCSHISILMMPALLILQFYTY